MDLNVSWVVGWALMCFCAINIFISLAIQEKDYDFIKALCFAVPGIMMLLTMMGWFLIFWMS